MAKAIKSFSFFAVFFLLFLVIFEVPKTEADDECKRIYEGYPLMRCLAEIFPSLCYRDCKREKGALSGDCVKGESIADYKCICDFCNDPYFPPDSLNIMQANAA